MRRLIITIISIGILVIVGVMGYRFITTFTYTRHINLPAYLLASSSTEVTTPSDDEEQTQAIQNTFGSIDQTVLIPASSTIDMTSWVPYTNSELGYSVQYPHDLVANTDSSGVLTLAVPKEVYFHWPLLDDVKITITATSSCPQITTDSPDTRSMKMIDNGYTFVRSIGSGVGAGNIYREVAYDLNQNAVCYHIDLLDHGTNGAGFYVGDQALIVRYDNQHQVDLKTVLTLFSGLVHSFHIQP